MYAAPRQALEERGTQKGRGPALGSQSKSCLAPRLCSAQSPQGKGRSHRICATWRLEVACPNVWGQGPSRRRALSFQHTFPFPVGAGPHGKTEGLRRQGEKQPFLQRAFPVLWGTQGSHRHSSRGFHPVAECPIKGSVSPGKEGMCPGPSMGMGCTWGDGGSRHRPFRSGWWYCWLPYNQVLPWGPGYLCWFPEWADP